MKEAAAFFWLFVHPHQKSFLSVTTDVIYTAIGSYRHQARQSTVEAYSKIPALKSLHEQGLAIAARHSDT